MFVILLFYLNAALSKRKRPLLSSAFGSRKTCQFHEIAVQCGPRGLKGSPDTLYHNNGDGTFTEVAKEAGVDDANHYFGLGAVWSDFDNDGKLDLLVANDGEPNYLYRNEGNGRFKEMAYDAGVAVSEDGVEQANTGLALGDYMNVGRMSVVVTHFSDEYAAMYRNDGGMSFTDVSRTAGISNESAPFVGWGDAFLDLNNSGWLDLVLVNGHVYPQVDSVKIGATYKEPKLVFQNQRNGSFHEVGAQTGSAVLIPQVSRGLAVGDLFNRGRLDIVVENLTGGPMILEAKSNPANHWVSFELEGSPSNKLALNARVRLTAGKAQQMGEVRSGGSYLSQSDLRLHFGLGDTKRIDKVEVLWPNGISQVFQDVPANCFYHLKQGGVLTLAHVTQPPGH
jgi:enediyne biosynthesis protein E4